MSALHPAMVVFKDLSDNANCSCEAFDMAIDILKQHYLSGFKDNIIKPLISVLVNDKLKAAHRFVQLLSCIIPEGQINGSIVDDALTWVLSVYHDRTVAQSKINHMLQWIAGLLEFNLVERQIVDGFYDLFYGLLMFQHYQLLGCKLIFMLTRPEDINRSRVNLFLKYHKTNPKAKHIKAVLGLFKSYRSELVPENFPLLSIRGAFKSIPAGMRVGFENAQQRLLELSDTQRLQDKQHLSWIPHPANKKGKTGVGLIPEPLYSHLGSELYGEKQKKVSEFLSKQTLAYNQLNLELPSSILSLLLNEGGIHLLATHNRDTQVRFSFVLYYALLRAFNLDTRSSRTTYLEREHLLDQLVMLEDYMQQGIPVVSRFLGEYIVSWNGLDHRSNIYYLLERVTFTSFQELNQCILGYLETLFISAEISEKCLILRTLQQLISNMFVSSGLLKKNMNRFPTHFFLGMDHPGNTVTAGTLVDLIKFVGDLSCKGLLITMNDTRLLNAVVTFFETLAILEHTSGQALTVIPPAAVYSCLFGTDLSLLSRVCGLLLRYQKDGELLRQVSGAAIQKRNLLNEYSSDFFNCLLNNKAFSKSDRGYIFRKDNCSVENLRVNLQKGNSAFSLAKHFTVLGLCQQMKKMGMADSVLFDAEDVTDALQNIFEDLCKFVQEVQKLREKCHGKNNMPVQ